METDEDAAGQTEEEDEAAEGGAGSLFDGSLDPLSLLEGMALHQEDDAASQQPFEVLASSKRRAKQALASGAAAGGQVCVPPSHATARTLHPQDEISTCSSSVGALGLLY